MALSVWYTYFEYIQIFFLPTHYTVLSLCIHWNVFSRRVLCLISHYREKAVDHLLSLRRTKEGNQLYIRVMMSDEKIFSVLLNKRKGSIRYMSFFSRSLGIASNTA